MSVSIRDNPLFSCQTVDAMLVRTMNNDDNDVEDEGGIGGGVGGSGRGNIRTNIIYI